MTLFNFLMNKNKKQPTIDFAANMPTLTQPIQGLQVDENGGVQNANIQPERSVTFLGKMSRARGALADALLGKRENMQDTLSAPMLNEDGNMTISGTLNSNPRRGGMLNDIRSGAKENFATGFAANNWDDKFTPDGRNKGWAYRIGEGLGTLGRFGESSLGRGLITAGLVGLTGGNGLEALSYGTQAGALNNRLRNEDMMYRNEMLRNAQQSLINSPQFGALTPEEQQAQLNEVAQGVNNMRGYVTPQVYDNLIRSQQLRDNAEYKRMYYDNQLQQQKAMQDFRQDQLEYTKMKDAQDRAFRQQQLSNENAYRNAQIGLGYANLNSRERQALAKNQQQNKVDKTVTENMQTLADIDAGLQMITENPGAYSWIKGKMGADLANRIDPKGVKTRTQIDNITAVYRKWLTGAQMSDAERKAYERFLPAPTDNAQIVKAKLQGMKDSIERKNAIIMQNANYGGLTDDDNPLGLDL